MEKCCCLRNQCKFGEKNVEVIILSIAYSIHWKQVQTELSILKQSNVTLGRGFTFELKFVLFVNGKYQKKISEICGFWKKCLN